MATSKNFQKKLGSSSGYQNAASNLGPRFLISRAHLMLSKIKLQRDYLQQKYSDDVSLRLSFAVNEDFDELSIFESDHMKSYAAGWNGSKQMIKENIYEIIWRDIQRHEHTDLLVKIGNVVFRSHTSLLNCYTKYFSKHKQRNQVEIKDAKMPAIAFMKIYNWMLQESITITQNDVLHLLCAGEVLNVEELRKQCWTVLDNTNVYTESVAYELYRVAKRYGVQSIQQLMLPRIWKYFLTFLATEDYLKMDAADVCQWLRANTIGVNSEMEVFYSAVLWVNFKWNERKGKPLRKVMNCVRFGLLPSWFLVSLHTTKHAYDVDRVVRDMNVKKLIADGLSLTTAMLFYSKDAGEFDEFLRRGNLQVPMQRKWLVDNACSYHYYQGSQKLQHITYEKFVDYLQYLRTQSENHWRGIIAASENHWSFVFNLRPNPMMLNVK